MKKPNKKADDKAKLAKLKIARNYLDDFINNYSKINKISKKFAGQKANIWISYTPIQSN